MSRGRGLAPLVGAGMAAVAAGSLVLFSLLAQQTALTPQEGQIILPRTQMDSDGPSVTLPPPSGSPQIDGGLEAPFVVTSPADERSLTIAPPVGPPSSLATGGAETSPADTLLASLDLPVRIDEAMDFRGPLVGVRPTGSDEPAKEGPGSSPEKECPAKPTKPRTPGEHPHGGPPACGNPHGAPPGQSNKPEHASSGDHGAGPASPPAGGSSNGGGPPGNPPSNPPNHNSTPPKETNGGSPPEHSSAGGNPSGSSGGTSHPHGAPPGQTKKESPPPSDSSGHPHGAPPGQAKK